MSDLESSDLSIGSLIRKAFNLFFAGFNKFVILSIPIAILSVYYLYISNQLSISQFTENSSYAGLATYFVSLFLFLIISILFNASFYNLAYQEYINPPGERIVDSIKKGFKRFFPLIGITFLFAIIGLIISLLIFIPIFLAFPSLFESGIQNNILILIIAVIMIILFLIFMVPFYLFATPHICVNGKAGVFETMNKSFEKIRGKRLKGFAYLLIINLLQIAFALMLIFIAFIILSLFGGTYGMALKDIISIAETSKLNFLIGIVSAFVSVITVPFNVSALIVFYRELEEKEVLEEGNQI